MKIGSLFSGYGGLELGVQAVIGGEVAWHVEFDAAPSKILAHRFPGVLNYGDITKVDWSTVEPVDVLTGGFPCQDVSLAGLRRGLRAGTRSGLWSEFAVAIDKLRPQLVVIENVRGLLSAEANRNMESHPWGVGDGSSRSALRALGAVLGDLAELGYDAEWCGVRAAETGAPHGRFRVFVLAHSNSKGRGRLGWFQTDACDPYGRRGPYRDGDQAEPETPSDAQSKQGRVGYGDDVRAGRGTIRREPAAGRASVEDTYLAARSEWGQSAPGQAEVGRAWADASGRSGTPATDAEPRESTVAWGAYGAAIARWEHALGRIAPSPTEPTGKGGAQRLSPVFVEWMMGLPNGWLTAPEIGLTRAQQLKALGNGVVPQQAALAVRTLLQTEEVAA